MAPGRALTATLDRLAFASAIPAGVAAGLLLAAGTALGEPLDRTLAALAALAGAGTLVVYNVDRLRDTGMDRESAPLRTAFIERHRRGLWAVTGATALASLALALATSREVVSLCAAVLAVGLLHRRLKRWSAAKPVYIAIAWVAVTAGIPALTASDPQHAPWVVAVYAATIAANLLASDLREAEPVASLLAGGRALAGVGLLVALVGPAATRPLAAIPASELVALAAFRTGERYALIVLDGALLVGATLALALQAG